MDTAIRQQVGLRLVPGKVLRLADAAGRHLSVIDGTVWITQRGDHRDPIVEQGESFGFTRDGLSLVQPLGGDAVVVLEDGLAPEVEGLDQTIAERARALREEAPRMRAQAVAAMIAGVAGLIASAWRSMRRTVAGPVSPTYDVSRLSDHLLRDAGLRRDEIRLTARRGPCLEC